MSKDPSVLDALLQEDRTFPPPPEFAKAALVRDPAVYEEAEADFQAYWEGWARELDWYTRQ